MRYCEKCDKTVIQDHAHCNRCGGVYRLGYDCPQQTCSPPSHVPGAASWIKTPSGNRRPTPASDYRPPAGQSPAQSNYRYQRAVERNRARRGEHREPAND